MKNEEPVVFKKGQKYIVRTTNNDKNGLVVKLIRFHADDECVCRVEIPIGRYNKNQMVLVSTLEMKNAPEA